MATRLELPKFQAFDSNGNPLSGGLLYTYIVGTTTEKATYTTATAAVEQSNPIVLNARGESTVEGIYGIGFYKLVLKDSAGATIWTIPSVSGISESGSTSIGDYSDDFDAAITAIGATETTLVVDSASTMSAVVTVPATCTVIVREGGSIDMGGNALTFNGPLIVEGGSFTHDATLTINKSFQCGLYDIGWNPDYTVAFAVGVVDAVYPQWWGALGNGAHDDQPEIQAAVSSLTRGTVRLVAGTYKLNTMQAYTSANTGAENGIIVIAAEVSIKGDGRDSTILDVTLDDTFYGTIVVNGQNGVTIEDIAITGTATAYSLNYGGGIRVLLSSRVVVRNCHFEDLRGIGINFVGNAGLAAGDTDVNYYCTYGVVDGNILRNCNSDGIYHILSQYNSTVNNILYNCGNTDSIIYEASPHSTMSNNVIVEPQQRGILINTGSSFCTITGNTLYHYDVVGNYNSIYLASVRYCTITGNSIEYNSASGGTPPTGISSVPGLYDYVDTYHNISNNVIVGAGGSTDVTAIHIQTDYNLVEGNIIDNGTYGISIDAADYNSIRNNRISSDGQGIRVVGIDGRADPTYTDIIGNYIANGSYDIGTGTKWKSNLDSVLAAVATTTAVLDATSKQYESVTLDSTAGAISMTVGSGTYVGQILTIVMTNATASSTVTITNHQTSDPEVATFDAVDETGVFMWTGTEWITIFATCTFL